MEKQKINKKAFIVKTFWIEEDKRQTAQYRLPRYFLDKDEGEVKDIEDAPFMRIPGKSLSKFLQVSENTITKWRKQGKIRKRAGGYDLQEVIKDLLNAGYEKED